MQREFAALHPVATPPTPDEVPDDDEVTSYVTSKKAVNEVFSAPPKERAIFGDDLSYEELGGLYHGGEGYKHTLLRLVRLLP